MTIEEIAERNPEALKADGFDDCVIGMTEDGCIAYDATKMISKLMEQDGMDLEIATEYFDFNIAGAYLGEFTPIYITT
jgi:hypothetical protein